MAAWSLCHLAAACILVRTSATVALVVFRLVGVCYSIPANLPGSMETQNQSLSDSKGQATWLAVVNLLALISAFAYGMPLAGAILFRNNGQLMSGSLVSLPFVNIAKGRPIISINAKVSIAIVEPFYWYCFL